MWAAGAAGRSRWFGLKHWYQVQVFQAVSRRLAARASAIARSEPHTWPHSSYTAVSETA